MSALPRLATIERTSRLVRFVPTTRVGNLYSITWSARAATDGSTVRPSFSAVFTLMVSSTFAERLNRLPTRRSASVILVRFPPRGGVNPRRL